MEEHLCYVEEEFTVHIGLKYNSWGEYQRQRSKNSSENDQQTLISHLQPWGLYYFAVVVQLLSSVQLFGTPWTAAHQASLFFTISQSLLKLMSIVSMIPSNHLILCHPLLLLPSIFPNIRVFPNESIPHIRWLKYCSFNFSISPSREYSGQISFWID